MVGVLFLLAAAMSLIINAIEHAGAAEDSPGSINAAPLNEERH